MELGRYGVWSWELRRTGEAGVLDAAAELEELGFGALWLPGGAGGPVLDAVDALLGATRRVVVATGILNIWMHDADEVATRCAQLRDRYGDRFLLGLGVSHAALIDGVVPHGYRQPLATMGRYLDALDEASPAVAPGERVLAALGPRMLQMARTRSAGAHPYLVTPAHTAQARRELGPGPLLAPEQAVVVDADPRRARAAARAHLATYARLPNYVSNWRRLGFGDDDVTDGCSDRLVDALVAWGPGEAVAGRIGEHLDAGADHVCVQALPPADRPASPDRLHLPLRQWRELAAVLPA